MNQAVAIYRMPLLILDRVQTLHQLIVDVRVNPIIELTAGLRVSTVLSRIDSRNQPPYDMCLVLAFKHPLLGNV